MANAMTLINEFLVVDVGEINGPIMVRRFLSAYVGMTFGKLNVVPQS